MVHEDRTASFGSCDKLLAQKVAHQQCPEAAAAEQLKRTRRDMEASTSVVSLELVTDVSEDGESSDTDEGDNFKLDCAYAVSTDNFCCKKATGTTAFIPQNVLSKPNIVTIMECSAVVQTTTAVSAGEQADLSQQHGPSADISGILQLKCFQWQFSAVNCLCWRNKLWLTLSSG